MKIRPLFWQVFPAFGAIVFFSMLAAAWYASHAIRTFHYSQIEQRLVAAAGMAIEHLTATLDELDAPEVDRTCDSLGAASGYRITVILPSGRVTGDSKEDPAVMDDHSTRPEIRGAFVDGQGCSRRFSNTLKMNMMYVAVAVPGDGEPRAVLRTSLSLADVDGAVDVLRHRIIIAGVILAFLAAALSFVVSRRISRPIQRMRDGAALFADGDLSTRLDPCDISEVNLLGHTMNTMAEQLRSRIDDITRQRDEQDALFTCMTESVIAVDMERRVLKMNAAAEKLFGVESGDCRGRNIVEIIRNSELLEIVERTLDGGEPTEDSLYLFDRDMYLHVHGTVLHGPSRDSVGAVLVLSDVTRIRQLEAMRQDSGIDVPNDPPPPGALGSDPDESGQHPHSSRPTS